MDLLKNEFKMKLRATIKEEQLLCMNNNNTKKILNRAIEIRKEKNYQ